MQAWSVTGVGQPQDVIEIGEKDIPQPGPGEVQIAIEAAGIGLPDVLMCKGEYAFKPELPFTPGQEVAGKVVALGEGCTLNIGDRVMGVTAFYNGHGSFAQYCLAPEFTLYPCSSSLTAEQAAGFCIPYHTAAVGLQMRGALQEGEVLLVHGAAGGSGSIAVELGKAMGATVIATASTAPKLEFCLARGADHVINYVDEDFSAKVLELTDGRGADVVYDPVGGEIMERSVSCTATGGRLLAIGFASGRWGSPKTNELVMGNCSHMGVFVGAYGHEQMLACHAELMQLVDAGKLVVQPENVISLEEIGQYLTLLERREIQGKIVASMRVNS